VSHVRAESRLHVEEGDIHLRLSDAYPLKVIVTVAFVTVVIYYYVSSYYSCC
jgi:hypothetical protein